MKLNFLLPTTLTVALTALLASCGSGETGGGNGGGNGGGAPSGVEPDSGGSSEIEEPLGRPELPETTPVHLDAEGAAKLLAENSDVIPLDVRTPKETDQDTIEGATIIDFFGDGFADKLGALDKTKPWLVYCKSGGRSSKTMEQMQDMGFKRIYHLDGGMTAWAAAGKPTTK